MTNTFRAIEQLRQNFISMETSASKQEITKGVKDAISLYATKYVEAIESPTALGESQQLAETALSNHASNDWAALKPKNWSRPAAQALAYFAFHLDLESKLDFTWHKRASDATSASATQMPKHEHATKYLQDDTIDLGYLITPCKVLLMLDQINMTNTQAMRTLIVAYVAKLSQRPVRQLTLEELALRSLLTLWLRQDDRHNQEIQLPDPVFPVTTISLGRNREIVTFCMQLHSPDLEPTLALHLQRYELHLPPRLTHDERNGWKHRAADRVGKTSVLRDGATEIEWDLEIPAKGEFFDSTTDSGLETFTVICPNVKKDPWTQPVQLVRARDPEWRQPDDATARADVGDDKHWRTFVLKFETREQARGKIDQVLHNLLDSESAEESSITLLAVAGVAGMGRQSLVDDVLRVWGPKEVFQQRVVVLGDLGEDAMPIVSRRSVDGQYGWNPDSCKSVLKLMKEQIGPLTACFIFMAKLDETSVGDILEATVSGDFLNSRSLKRVTIELANLEPKEITLVLQQMLNEQASPDTVVLDPRCGRLIRDATDGYAELVIPLLERMVFNVSRKRGWYISRQQIDDAINDLCSTNPQSSEDIHGAIKAYVSSHLLRAFSAEKKVQYDFARWVLHQIDDIQSKDASQSLFKSGASEEQLAQRALENGRVDNNLLKVLNRLVETNLLAETDSHYKFRSGFLSAWARREAAEFSKLGSG